MRRVGRVRLALIDERRVGVRRAAEPIGPRDDLAAVQGHEPGPHGDLIAVASDAIGAKEDQRVVVLERHEDRSRTTVGDLVEAVIEELAEDREQRVERRRQADVGGYIRDEQRLMLPHAVDRLQRDDVGAVRILVARDDPGVALGAHREAGCGDRGRVVGCLVDDQVADRSWLGVGDASGRLRVTGGVTCLFRAGAVRVER